MPRPSHLTPTRAVLLSLLATAAALTALVSARAAGPSGLPAGAPVAVVDPAPRQAIEGFGASGAWWARDFAAFPPALRDRVASLLFGRDGIALSAFRFEIGGGGAGVTDPGRATPTFLVRPGVYDWRRGEPGVSVLRYARRGGVPLLVGFAASPPAAWTTNARTCGGRLRAGAEGTYAAYLADVAAHLRDAEGITLTHLSPMNEPDHDFHGCQQEGAIVPVAQRARLVRSVAVELRRRSLPTQVIADESSWISTQFLPHVRRWLGSREARSIGAIATHMYDYPGNDTLRAAADEAARAGRPLWMTEICCHNGSGFGPRFDPTMTSGLWLANTIWQSLAVGNHSLFSWWVALSPAAGCDLAAPGCATTPNAAGWDDGLLYYDPSFRTTGSQTLVVTKRFWVLGNFSRYVRPGAVRHDVARLPDGVRVAAFSRDGSWTVVAINNNAAATPVAIRLPGSGDLAVSGAVETSVGRDLAPVTAPLWFDGDRTLLAALAPSSVTTATLSPR